MKTAMQVMNQKRMEAAGYYKEDIGKIKNFLSMKLNESTKDLAELQGNIAVKYKAFLSASEGSETQNQLHLELCEMIDRANSLSRSLRIKSF